MSNFEKDLTEFSIQQTGEKPDVFIDMDEDVGKEDEKNGSDTTTDRKQFERLLYEAETNKPGSAGKLVRSIGGEIERQRTEIESKLPNLDKEGLFLELQKKREEIEKLAEKYKSTGDGLAWHEMHRLVNLYVYAIMDKIAPGCFSGFMADEPRRRAVEIASEHFTSIKLSIRHVTGSYSSFDVIDINIL